MKLRRHNKPKVKVQTGLNPFVRPFSRESDYRRYAEGKYGRFALNGSCWDLYRDGVTQGLLQKFLTCRRQCELVYSEGWTPNQNRVALAYGGAVHAALERYYERPKRSVSSVMSWLEKQPWMDFGKHPETGERMTSKSASEWKEEILGCTELLLDGYVKRWRKDFGEARKFLFREKLFDLPFETEPGIEIRLRGVIDGAYELPNGDVYLLDTKTMGRMVDEEHLEASLPFDFQLNFYCFVYLLATGKAPKGLCRDLVRKPGQSKAHGLVKFLAAAKADIEKRPEHYFHRFTCSKNLTHLLDWADKVLRPLLYEIIQWVHGRSATYVNANSLYWGYSRCDVFDIITQNDYTDFYQREEPFPELSR